MYWYLVFLVSLLSFPLSGQNSYYASYYSLNKRVEVRLGESSYVVINGKTNVNKFNCYCDQLSTKPLPITVFQEADAIKVKNAVLKLQTDQFDCENKVMNSDFQQLLQSEEYPHIEIQILRLSEPPNSDKKLTSQLSDEPFTVWVEALFKIVGNERHYSFPVEITDHAENILNLQGSVHLNLLDFDITPPKKLLGLVEVQELITIDFFAKLRVAQP